VKALADRGAVVGLRDVQEWRPLREAAVSGDRETVAALLAAGVSS